MKHSRLRSSYPLIVSLFIVCLLLIIMTSSTPAGQIYTWIDENGTAHISDLPPDKPVNTIEKHSIKPEQNKSQQKSSIDKMIEAEIQKIEADHLRVVDDANKKFLEKKRMAEETYEKEISKNKLRNSKEIEEIDKLIRDVRDGKK